MYRPLDDGERARLTAQHKQERDQRIRDRIKAVLLHDKGWSLRQIAEVLLISDEAVRSHIQDYDISKKLRHKVVVLKQNDRVCNRSKRPEKLASKTSVFL